MFAILNPSFSHVSTKNIRFIVGKGFTIRTRPCIEKLLHFQETSWELVPYSLVHLQTYDWGELAVIVYRPLTAHNH